MAVVTTIIVQFDSNNTNLGTFTENLIQHFFYVFAIMTGKSKTESFWCWCFIFLTSLLLFDTR